MRKIDLVDYEVKGVFNGEERKLPYSVKDSLADMLLTPQLKLNGAKLLKNNLLAAKILQAKDSVLLEDEEYQRLESAINSIEGLGKHDVQLVERVLNAEKAQIN